MIEAREKFHATQKFLTDELVRFEKLKNIQFRESLHKYVDLQLNGETEKLQTIESILQSLE
jgi:hypothetical protein